MNTLTRRSFYQICIHGLGSVMGVALAIPGLSYLLAKPKVRKRGDWVQAADLNQLPARKPEEVVFHRTRVDGWRVVNEKTTAWVVKLDDKNAIAYVPSCTHLGCAYHWDDQIKNFICPCHTSTFSIDGEVLAGPAPRPLDRYAIQVEGGKLFIGSQIQKA